MYITRYCFYEITSRNFNLNVFTVLNQQSSRVPFEVKHEHITLTLNGRLTNNGEPSKRIGKYLLINMKNNSLCSVYLIIIMLLKNLIYCSDVYYF